MKAVVDSKSIAESLCDPRSEGKPGGLGGPGGPLGSGGPPGKSGSSLPSGLRWLGIPAPSSTLTPFPRAGARSLSDSPNVRVAVVHVLYPRQC